MQGATYIGKALLQVPLIATVAHATMHTLQTLSKAVQQGVKLTATKVQKIVNHHFKPPDASPILITSEGIVMPLDNTLRLSQNGIITFAESAHPISTPYLRTAAGAAQESSVITPAHTGLITDAAEITAEMERIRSIPHEVIVDRIMNTGSYLGYTAAESAQVIEAFKNPAINVPIVFFVEGIQRFHHIPGGKKIINNIFKSLLKPKGHNRANGSLYELAAATNFEITTKETILELSKEIITPSKLSEHDFVSKLHLGESKNVCWEFYAPNMLNESTQKSTNNMIEQLATLAINAHDMSRQPILITRRPIPDTCTDIWQSIVNFNIKYHIYTP